jgi:hypothetical protein
MFPGCTVLEIRTRHQDVLREAGYKPLLRQYGEGRPADRGMRLGRLLLRHVSSLLAALGL